MEKQRWEESEKRKNQKKEDPGARKGRKVAKICVFPILIFAYLCSFGGPKGRLTKGAEPSGRLRDQKNARRCGAKHGFQVKMHKAFQVRSTLGS